MCRNAYVLLNSVIGRLGRVCVCTCVSVYGFSVVGGLIAYVFPSMYVGWLMKILGGPSLFVYIYIDLGRSVHVCVCVCVCVCMCVCVLNERWVRIFVCV